MVLGAGVLLYDRVVCEEEQLTYAAHRYQERHPWITRLVVAVTALHLLRLLPPPVDPFCRFAE